MDQPLSTTARVGRPRKFDAATERTMVMDAALRVMARNGFAETSVGEVLGEAGLSTRSFYRHFDSKGSLLTALIERDAASVGRSLEKAVASADDPVAALHAWLERFLDVFYEPKRAARVALFSSPGIRESYPLADGVRNIRRVFCLPLIEALRVGHLEGSLRSPTPEADAHSLYALASAATDRYDNGFPDRSAARAHVIRFAWPALGLPLSSGGRGEAKTTSKRRARAASPAK